MKSIILLTILLTSFTSIFTRRLRRSRRQSLSPFDPLSPAQKGIIVGVTEENIKNYVATLAPKLIEQYGIIRKDILPVSDDKSVKDLAIKIEPTEGKQFIHIDFEGEKNIKVTLDDVMVYAEGKYVQTGKTLFTRRPTESSADLKEAILLNNMQIVLEIGEKNGKPIISIEDVEYDFDSKFGVEKPKGVKERLLSAIQNFNIVQNIVDSIIKKILTKNKASLLDTVNREIAKACEAYPKSFNLGNIEALKALGEVNVDLSLATVPVIKNKILYVNLKALLK